MQPLDWLRVLFSVTLLSYCSLSDLKTREVSNTVWVIGFPVGAVLTVVGVLIDFNFDTLIVTLVSMAVSSLLAIGLFYLNLFGGADSKGLIFISLCIPLYPKETFTPLSIVIPVFPLSVFDNAILLSLSVAALVLFKNLAWALKGKPIFEGVNVKGLPGKALLVVTSYRARIDELMEKTYLYPAEKPVEAEGGVVRRPIYFTKAEAEKAELMREVKEYAAKGLYADGVLVTPTIPMIVFITFGLLTALYGDLVVLIALRVVGV